MLTDTGQENEMSEIGEIPANQESSVTKEVSEHEHSVAAANVALENLRELIRIMHNLTVSGNGDAQRASNATEAAGSRLSLVSTVADLIKRANFT